MIQFSNRQVVTVALLVVAAHVLLFCVAELVRGA